MHKHKAKHLMFTESGKWEICSCGASRFITHARMKTCWRSLKLTSEWHTCSSCTHKYGLNLKEVKKDERYK